MSTRNIREALEKRQIAAFVQRWSAWSKSGERLSTAFGVLPVSATAVVLFVVIAPVVPRLGAATNAALRVVLIYITFAIVAPLIGWNIGRLFRLDTPAGRSVAFSVGARNSFVVLRLAFAVPGAIPVLPAVIVTQTLVEPVSELIYIRLIPKLRSDITPMPASRREGKSRLQWLRTPSTIHMMP